MIEDAKPGNATRIIPPEPESQPAAPAPVPQAPQETAVFAQPEQSDQSGQPDQQPPITAVSPVIAPELEQVSPVLQAPPARNSKGAEDLLSQMAGSSNKDEALKQVAEASVSQYSFSA